MLNYINCVFLVKVKKKPALKGAGLIAVYQEVIPEIILVKNRILMVGESGK